MIVFAVLRATDPPDVVSAHWFRVHADRAAARLKRREPTAIAAVVTAVPCPRWNHDPRCLVLDHGEHVEMEVR